MELEERRGRLTLLVVTRSQGRLLLRRGDGLRGWYAALRAAVESERGREGAGGLSVRALHRRDVFSDKRSRSKSRRRREEEQVTLLKTSCNT